jgi:excisionase family DNA binding protein
MSSASSLRVTDAEYLSTGQAARRLGVSEGWVRKLILAGRLPAVATPLGRVVPQSAVEEFARLREQGAASAGVTP